MEEIWKDIQGYEGIYKISNLSNIKSLSRSRGCVNKTNELILKNSKNSNGYLTVSLCDKNNKRKHHRVHVLLAKHFIENLENKKCVNHINGIKTDNRIENLEWVTYSENNLHAYKTKLKIPNYKKVYCINNNKVYESLASAAKELGLYKQHISAVCRKKINSTKGYRFEYL